MSKISSQSARHNRSDIGGALHVTETDPWQFQWRRQLNGGGRHYSIDYGYGIVDALRAVRMAETWASPARRRRRQPSGGESYAITRGILRFPTTTLEVRSRCTSMPRTTSAWKMSGSFSASRMRASKI